MSKSVIDMGSLLDDVRDLGPTVSEKLSDEEIKNKNKSEKKDGPAKAVDIDQPAVKDIEKPDKDQKKLGDDNAVEPVDLSKKLSNTELSTMIPLKDDKSVNIGNLLDLIKKETKPVSESISQLVREIPDIDQENQEILFTAIDRGIISDVTPSYNVMMLALVQLPEAEKVDIATAIAKPSFKGFADIADVAASYIEKVLLPNARKSLGYDKGETIDGISQEDDWEKPIPENTKRNKTSLYICNSCCKTGRNNEAICVHCESKDVENVSEGSVNEDQVCLKCGSPDISKVGNEVKCLSCGYIDYIKPAEDSLDIPARESTLKEEEESFTPIAKGIADKNDADNLAREKNGHVVEDMDDKEKFMVVVKETYYPEEDKYSDERSQVIAKMLEMGYSLAEEQKAVSGLHLEFRKGDQIIKVFIAS